MSETMEVMAQPNQPVKQTACVEIPKSLAQKLKMDQSVTYTTMGKITGIHKGFGLGKPNSEENYRIDVEVDEIKGFENNSADVEMQKLKDAQ